MASLLIEAYSDSPTRLARALMALQHFMDHGMALLTDAYLDAKESALRESERSRVATELRLQTMEAEAARRALHTSEETLRTFVANAKDYLIVLLDPGGHVQPGTKARAHHGLPDSRSSRKALRGVLHTGGRRARRAGASPGRRRRGGSDGIRRLARAK